MSETNAVLTAHGSLHFGWFTLEHRYTYSNLITMWIERRGSPLETQIPEQLRVKHSAWWINYNVRSVGLFPRRVKEFSKELTFSVSISCDGLEHSQPYYEWTLSLETRDQLIAELEKMGVMEFVVEDSTGHGKYKQASPDKTSQYLHDYLISAAIDTLRSYVPAVSQVPA